MCYALQHLVIFLSIDLLISKAEVSYWYAVPGKLNQLKHCFVSMVTSKLHFNLRASQGFSGLVVSALTDAITTVSGKHARVMPL